MSIETMAHFQIFFSIFSLIMTLHMRGLGAPNNHNDDESSLLAIKSRLPNTNSVTVLAKNWTQLSPHCSWIGVSCGSQRHPLRVTALNLSYMGLEGTIPQEIGNLSFLWYLDLRNNSFSGSIPDMIGNLGRLRVLEMRYNQLGGRIPATFGRLTKLQNLYLSVNKLTGTIPRSIFNLSSLLDIRLGANLLHGNLPQDICIHLPKLRFLALSENQLSGDIPSSIPACGELETLSLSFNNFSGSIPAQLGNLTRLQTLYVSRNNLAGVIPTSSSNMSNLEILDVGENSLDGAIPSEIGHLSKLSWLIFASNKLTGRVPNSLFNLTSLQKLSLADNDLSGELPSSISTGLPNLALLYIADNRFHGTIPSSISNLSQLLRIDLGSNSFTGLIPSNIANIPNLQRLLLPENLFTNNLSIPEQDFLTPLANCKYLNEIELESNPTLTGLLPKSFFSANSNLSTTLEHFIASSCRISGEIPPEISSLSSLIWLSLGNNMLEGEIPQSFGRMTKLQRLEVHNNTLQGPIPHSICNLKSLFELSLSGNKLSGHVPLCLGTDLDSLREIDLSENAFNSSIPSTLWSTGSSLLKMSFRNNFLDGTLPRDIGKLNSLTELDISGNQLSGDIPVSIRQLQSLTLLSLSNNKLNGSIPDSFSDLKALQHLDLSHNNLSGQIPMSLESLPDLGYFNVSFNELTGEIPSKGPFSNFTAECFMGNKDLCGAAQFKVKECKSAKSKMPSKSRLLRYIILPIASIFVAAIVLFLFIRYRCGKSSNTSSLSDLPLAGLLQERIPYHEVVRATNNFDETYLIGKGSFGSVYKGEFADGMVAAVKVFDLEAQGGMKSFDTECEIMRNIRHRNLLKVITSCSNLDFKALVIEYMPNGSLGKWLYSVECSLNISQRFGIMLDVAAALDYLHHDYSTPIIHCDLKPSNILLDNDMVAHVSDFGIAKLCSREEIMQQTKTLGTIGYMAPEYGSGGFISTAADVYSYGIVVLETFTRKKPTDEMFSEGFTLRKWVSGSFPDSLMHIVDFELLNKKEESVKAKNIRGLTLIIELALECTTEVAEERPTINSILAKLGKIKTDL